MLCEHLAILQEVRLLRPREHKGIQQGRVFLWSFRLILTILSTLLQDGHFTDVETETQNGQGSALL